jgi:hypothetical protein
VGSKGIVGNGWLGATECSRARKRDYGVGAIWCRGGVITIGSACFNMQWKVTHSARLPCNCMEGIRCKTANDMVSHFTWSVDHQFSRKKENYYLILGNEAVNFGKELARRMASSGMLHRVALVRTDVSEELGTSIIRVTRIGELRT